MGANEELPTDLEATFSLLADETRLAILQELWERDEQAVEFADLRKDVGMRDSGNFSYHLDRLVPQFVRQGEGGYELTWAGAQVVGAAISGTYSAEAVEPTDPVEGGDCWNCEGTVEMRYDGEFLVAECTDCDEMRDQVPAPPILASAFEPEEYPQVFSRYGMTQVQKRSRGLCLLCDGPVEQELVEQESVETPVPDALVAVRHTCQACGLETHASVASAVFDHPAVQAFFHDAGFDLRKDPLFELPDPEEDVVAGDPLRVIVRLAAAGETLVLTLDEDLDVVDYERR